MPHQPLSLSTTPNLHLSLLAQELVAAEEDEGTLHVAAEQHYQITLIRCDQEHLQESRGGRRGRRNLTRGRWERLWSPVCSQWVGLSEDALGVETWTYNFTSSLSSPLSASSQITKPGCISSAREHLLPSSCTNTCSHSPEGREHNITDVHRDGPQTPFCAFLAYSCSVEAPPSQGGTKHCLTLHNSSPTPGPGCYSVCCDTAPGSVTAIHLHVINSEALSLDLVLLR